MADVAALEKEIAEIEAELQDYETENATNVEVIKLEGLVVLKIIKHCKQGLPELVTGQLLGLARGNTVEVTNCFPFPHTQADEEAVDSGDNYQLEMMKSLREVNADSNTVGWYQSCYLGSTLSESVIESQFNYQNTIKKSFVLTYDPLQSSTQGILALKALRLTDAFMELYKSQSFTQKSLDQARLSFNDIFEEINISISNSHLISAYLWEIEGNKTLSQIGLKGLDLSNTTFLEKNVEVIIEYIDDLNMEQLKYQNYHRSLGKQQSQLQKRKLENNTRRANGEPELPEDDIKLAPPSRLEHMLITNQINNHCQQVNRFANQSLTKLSLFNGLANSSN